MRKGVFFAALYIVFVSYLSLKSPDYQIQRVVLSKAINTQAQEVRPLVSTDGKTLYFSRRNYEENNGGQADLQDVWMAKLTTNGSWEAAINMGSPINNKHANTLCSISEDGKTAFLLDSYVGVKTPLVKSELTDQGWGKPEAVEIENFVNLSSYYDFYHSESNNILLMAIDKGTGRGDQDLHVSFSRKDGSYSEPVNLGRTINTQGADFAPFLGTDGETLFFASTGHPGQGGADLFMTRRLDKTWKRWAPPENLGNIINSANEEIYISVDGNFENVYIETFPKNAKIKNIVKVKLPERFKPNHLKNPDFPQELLTDQHLRKEVDYYDISPERKEALVGTPFIAPMSTSFEVPLEGETYSESQTLAHSPISPDPVWQNPIPSPNTNDAYPFATKRVELDGGLADKVAGNVYFQFNNRAFREQFKPQLDKVLKVLLENPGMRVEVHGHTDNFGHQSINQSIGFLRASSVARYLINRGIPESRFEIVSFGETRPMASNDDEWEGRELNRRVELNLIDESGISMVYYLH